MDGSEEDADSDFLRVCSGLQTGLCGDEAGGDSIEDPTIPNDKIAKLYPRGHLHIRASGI